MAAHASDLRQILLLFHVVPIYYSTGTFVTCSCGASLISSQKAHVLEGADSGFTARYLHARISPILKTLLFGGLIAWILPVIGLIWMLGTFFWARKYGGWTKTLSIVLLAFAALSTAGLIIGTVFSPN